MPDNSLPPSLDLVEQEARIAKLKAERRLVERQERLEYVKAFGAPLAAIVTVIGVVISTSQWYVNNKANRISQSDERLERHIQQRGGADVAQRITAVASLTGALSGDDAAATERTVAALTGVLAVETSFPVRSSIVSALSTISGPRAAATRVLVLRELVEVSRGLVKEGKLRHIERHDYLTTPDASSPLARAASVANAMAALLRQGARTRDLSSTFLSGEDLSGVNLPDTNFQNAVLYGASFQGSTLNRSIFDDAVLAGTNFRHALLRGALFRQSGSSYVFDQAIAIQKMPSFAVVSGPVFDDAVLTGARFDGHPLFPIVPDAALNHFSVSGFSFRNAELDSVDLRKAWAFGPRSRGLSQGCDNYWNDLPSGQSLISFGGSPLELIAARVFSGPRVDGDIANCWRSVNLIGSAFRGSRRTKDLSPTFLETAIKREESRGPDPADPW